MSRATGAPASDVLEISLFGPGFGEALAVHLGGGRWMLVDSCIHRRSGRPSSLAYLEGLGVDVTEAVELVVISHWHDDHARGIGEIVQRCAAATVFASTALTLDDFLTILNYYRQHSIGMSSGVDELIKVYRALEERAARKVATPGPEYAIADRCIYRARLLLPTGGYDVEIWALSPSTGEVRRSVASFNRLIPQEGVQPGRVPAVEPNQTSVVLWCRVGDHQILLGADLERESDPSRGWTPILDRSTALPRKTTKALTPTSTVFKVAHHGGVSGHEPRVWSEILAPDPVSILTPWRIGRNLLPQRGDIERIKTLTSRAYITADPQRGVPGQMKYHQSALDVAPQKGRTIRPIYWPMGHIRLRCYLADPPGTWTVELLDGARRL
jgi:hypothetical protein